MTTIKKYDTPPLGILITALPDLRIISMNPEMESIAGIQSPLSLGQDFTALFFRKGGRLFHPDRSPLPLDRFRQHILSAVHGPVSPFEFFFRRADGKQRQVVMTCHPVPGLGESRGAVLSLFRTGNPGRNRELEKKVRDLTAMNATLEAIYNTSSESVWVCDGNGVVIRINKAAQALLGVHAGEVVGKHIDELAQMGFADQPVTRQVLDTGQQVSLLQSVPKTGKQLLVTGTPVFDEKGDISMVIINESDMTQLTRLQEQLQRVREEKSRIRDELSRLNLKELGEHEIVAHSKEMQDVLVTCRKLAQMNVSGILILGESGTGKGLMAKYIHSCNTALTGPMVKINCAAVPENLLEAELFGYEAGAFTGARDQGKIGLFEAAQGGTLFLDEIGELPLALQAKLLTCLEEREIMHIGGVTPIKIHCNIIAATNEDLDRKISRKQFRQDLFFRLNTFPVTIPPLRKRPEDIMELTLFFLKKYNRAYGLSRRIGAGELQRLQSHLFPGNVRELKNNIKRAVVMADKDELVGIFGQGDALSRLPAGMLGGSPDQTVPGFNRQVADFEKQILLGALETCKTTRAVAARLDMTQSQVVRKLKKYGLTSKSGQAGG